MRAKAPATALAILLLATLIVTGAPPPSPQAPAQAPDDAELQKSFETTVKPFLAAYCTSCHGGEKPDAQLDLTKFNNLASVVQDHPHWALVREKLSARAMPPKEATEFPSAEARQQVIDWIKSMRTNEARKHAGDPGLVLARRLSNSEYNYTIRDLTGVDIRPAREFPVDPANPAGFDNSGESLAMSPSLLTKYLQAAREVANHMVLRLDGIDFAPYPMLVETDRDKFCVTNIISFYRAQNTNLSDYFQSAWRYKHRAALGKPDATIAEVAAADKVSAKYLQTVWDYLDATREEVGPGATLQKMWAELPGPQPQQGNQPDVAKAGCERMRDWVVQLRAKVEPRFTNLQSGRVRANSQPMLMWKNRMYATHRMSYDAGALQIDGKLSKATAVAPTTDEAGADNEFGPGRTMTVRNKPGDADLFVPAAQRDQYEAAFGRFCAVFPDAFYVEERGRNYLDKTKDRGRYLSAGFHNVMGYFRDDQPLYELVLDTNQQKHLDKLWRELDYIASGNIRTYVQFFFNESGEARGSSRESEGPRPKDKEVIAEEAIRQMQASYLDAARGGGGGRGRRGGGAGRNNNNNTNANDANANAINAAANATTAPATSMPATAPTNPIAVQAVREHFELVNDGIRWVEKARVESQPTHLESLLEFAARAYRRPLSQAEREDLLAFYRSLREKGGLEHEDAMRDMVVNVLMSPDFCYRIDLVPDGTQVHPLSDYALASRLSYFLWSSMPDSELLSHAAAGDLHKPEVIAAQAGRMLKDPRVRGLAVEFGGNWLDFRRFEELNTVDRERYPSFDHDLRDSMFEEPIRYMIDVFQRNGSVLDFLYGNYTFVNSVLAKHYGMPESTSSSPKNWVRVDDAEKYGRGGILPMAAFLTKNAPGLRTSPVKRGYWVVKRVLGEEIPPPPAAVPELPRDEAKLELPLRDALAKHREDASCSSCHMRFDSLGVVLEGFGPIGERRAKDLAGHVVDPRATFPGGDDYTGLPGLRQYIRERRQGDFIDGLSSKLLAYALGRSLMLSDELTIEQMRTKAAADGYRFDSLIESIVTSPQFLTKRGREDVAQR